jgi:hypothetical protein
MIFLSDIRLSEMARAVIEGKSMVPMGLDECRVCDYLAMLTRVKTGVDYVNLQREKRLSADENAAVIRAIIAVAQGKAAGANADADADAEPNPDETVMTAASTLDTASSLVGGNRAASHGDMTANHQNIASLWEAYLNVKITPHDVALMMCLLKIARTKSGKTNPDDYVDLAGYAGIAAQIKGES